MPCGPPGAVRPSLVAPVLDHPTAIRDGPGRGQVGTDAGWPITRELERLSGRLRERTDGRVRRPKTASLSIATALI